MNLALNMQYSLITYELMSSQPAVQQQLSDLHIDKVFIKTDLYIRAPGCVVTHQADQKATTIQH